MKRFVVKEYCVIEWVIEAEDREQVRQMINNFDGSVCDPNRCLTWHTEKRRIEECE